ncbi:unnamed protein product, partial [Effrenium voratum]
MSAVTTIPSFRFGEVSSAQCVDFVERWRLLHIRHHHVVPAEAKKKLLHFILGSSLGACWTSESPSGSLQNACEAMQGAGGQWYSSFVLQGGLGSAFMDCLQEVVGPQVLAHPLGLLWHSTGTVWSFFGSNPSADSLAGKPEHRDQLRPGVITMHTQVSGEKIWKLRPSNDWDAPFLPCERLEVCCRPGDQLVIDTAAWYHATSIPPGTDFTWSVAQDLSSEENPIELESVQLRVSHQLCQLCMTPTAEPMGAPPGTCGCDCCSQKRLNHRLWRPSGPSIPKGPGDRWKIPTNYEVKQLIGTGSYGSVCEAFDTDKKRLVAIKRIAHMFEDLIDCKRILREIAILSKLEHENIVQVYDIVAPSNIHTFDELYMVMEICDSDLKKLCRTDVTLTPLHINTLLYNLLVGLRYLHSAGIYHRDLKPANCLVNQDCSVKICDFGLSRAIEAAEQPHLHALPNTPRGDGEPEAVPGVPHTQRLKRNLTGHVVTRWYRAPELILLQENYTEAIDIWSVGCIYAELLGMLEGTRTQDRGPLFPGSSCFPLSPDHKHKTDYKYHTRGKHDQLNMIFNLLGTPMEGDIEQLEREDAKRYIRCFAAREGDGLAAKFPAVDADAIDILNRMLRFNPKDRIAVTEALEHRLFTSGANVIRDTSRETSAPQYITLDFEKEPDLDEKLLRKYFCK